MCQVESHEYQSKVKRPGIHHTIYVDDEHLLLVSRQLTGGKHPFFPDQNEPQRLRLELSEYWSKKHEERYGRPPKFDMEHVNFGRTDEDIAVIALLFNTNRVASWDLSSLVSEYLVNSMGIVEEEDIEEEFRWLTQLTFKLASKAARKTAPKA